MDELLLDSSYLFPIFGVKLEYRDFESVFPRLHERFSVKYNPISLIEAKWYIIRRAKKKDKDRRGALFQRYRAGLLSLQKDAAIEGTPITSEQTEELADSILEEFGVRDYFDRTIYSTAATLQCLLLTEDRLLHELFKRADNSLPKPRGLLKWKDLL